MMATSAELRQMLWSLIVQVEALLAREGQPLPGPIRAQAALVAMDARDLLAGDPQEDPVERPGDP